MLVGGGPRGHQEKLKSTCEGYDISSDSARWIRYLTDVRTKCRKQKHGTLLPPRYRTVIERRGTLILQEI